MAYSDAKKTQAIILLATTGYDFEKVSNKMGIPEITLRRWGELQKNIDSEINDRKKSLPIPDMLEEAIKELLSMMPREWSGNSWGVAFGILVDKWLLMQGESTERKETILRGIENVEPEHRDEVIREAERILAEASGGGAASGKSQED